MPNLIDRAPRSVTNSGEAERFASVLEDRKLSRDGGNASRESVLRPDSRAVEPVSDPVGGKAAPATQLSLERTLARAALAASAPSEAVAPVGGLLTELFEGAPPAKPSEEQQSKQDPAASEAGVLPQADPSQVVTPPLATGLSNVVGVSLARAGGRSPAVDAGYPASAGQALPRPASGGRQDPPSRCTETAGASATTSSVDGGPGGTPPLAGFRRENVPASATTPDPAPNRQVPTPTEQVMAALGDLALDAAPRQTDAQPRSIADPAMRGGGQSVTSQASGLRALTVRLDPEHLGPVSITLRLQARSVDVRIAVSNPETLHLLERDRHILAALVEAAGHRPSTVAFSTDAAPNDYDNRTAFEMSPHGQRDAPSSDASGGGQSRQAAQSNFNPRSKSSVHDSPIAPPDRQRGLDGSLYL